MTKKTGNRIVTILLCCFVISCLILYGKQPADALEQGSDDTLLEQQVKEWVDELAAKTYTEWKGANFHISPLGPGTHSWLVQLKQEDKIVGYLIVNATMDGGYRLGEYGTGQLPIFNEQSLHLSMMRLELIDTDSVIEQLYSHPLLAVWSIQTGNSVYYTDAFSGEVLPLDAGLWEQLTDISNMENYNEYGLASTCAKLKESRLMPSFDPYARMPWLTSSPLALKDSAAGQSKLIAKLKAAEQLRYTMETYDGAMRYVWSVAGYDLWKGGELFVALDDDEDNAGRRYVPYSLLARLGQFYR